MDPSERIQMLQRIIQNQNFCKHFSMLTKKIANNQLIFWTKEKTQDKIIKINNNVNWTMTI